MRILILVLSYTEPPYNGMMQAQQETWDRERNEDVHTYYYYGGLKGDQPYSWEFLNGDYLYSKIKVNCPDDYYLMHWKLKICLDFLHDQQRDGDYDFIFRTNSSSYINKEKLLKRAETLPKERCYAGWSLGEKEAVSGAGIWLSPDMVDILREEIPPGENIEEDILIGRILHGKHGIEITDDRSRFDVTDVDSVPLDRYHYRMKTPDRLEDIRNMYRLHSRIKDMRR